MFVAFRGLKELINAQAAKVAILVLVLTPVITTVYSITRAGTSANNTAHAVSPTTLNFQARLLTSSGNLVPDGVYNVEFKVYNVSTGGSALWTETRLTTDPSGQQIVVKNGYLSAYLGDKTALPTTIWNQQLWLTMNIGGTSGSPSWDGEMTPRIRLTSVPFAFRATAADSAETLSKNTGSFTGTVDFANLTADRKYIFPDTSLATTASPGTICVYNGAASNCPAASGSAYYLQNDTVLQTQTNFHIQARDSGVNGTIGGVITGAANGQTVDLLQFRASDDSTVLAAVTAGGNLQVASSVDTRTATTLSLGNSTATAVSISKSGVTTTVNGALTVSEATTFNGNVAISGSNTLTVGTGATTLGGTLAVTGIATFSNGTIVQNGTATDDRITTSITTGGTARFDGTITNSDLTAARTWTLPDVSGTFITSGNLTAINQVGTITAGTWNGTALTDAYVDDSITIGSSGSVDWTALTGYPAACAAGQAITQLGDAVTCSAFATGSASSYIQNQNASQQATSNFWISGSGQADTSLITPTLTSTGALSIASASNGDITVDANGTGKLNLNDSVVVAAQQTIRMVGGTTAQRPASPTEGMLYFDTDTKQLLIYANGKWQADRSTATKIVAASNSSQAVKDAADYVASGTADQNIINAALTAAAGGKVYLAEGTYTLSAAVSVPNNTTLVGSGTGTLITIPNAQNGTYNFITNSDTTTGTNVVIQDMRLFGNQSNQTSGSMLAIYLDGMGGGSGTNTRIGARVSHVQISEFANMAVNITSTSNNNIISENTFLNQNGIVEIDGDFNTFTSNIARNTAYGVYVAGDKNTISNNSLETSDQSIIESALSEGGNIITGNTITVTSYRGISALGPYTVVSNNTIYVNGAAAGLDIEGTYQTVTGNTVYGASVWGILVDSASHTTITGNTVHDSGGSTANNGIYLDAADSNTIADNIINDSSCTTTCYAINISNNTSDTNYLADNTLNGGSINDAGTGTIYGGQSSGSTFKIQPGDDFTITGNAASTIQTTAGNLTLQAGSGTVTLGSSTALTATGALSITSGGANTLTVDAGGAAALNLGTTNANAVSISRTGVTTTVNGALTVTQAFTADSTAQFNGDVTVAAGKYLKLIGGNTASRPASPAEGMLYFDTDTKQLLTYANGKWQADRSTATKIVAASNSSQAVKDAADYVASGTADQNTINAALTAAAGGKVYLAEGTYTVNNYILVPDNTTLTGSGAGTLITLPNSFSTNMSLIANSNHGLVAGNQNITISNLKIDGNSSNVTGNQVGIEMDADYSGTTAMKNVIIENVILQNLTSSGIYSESHNSQFKNNTIDNAREGIDIQKGSYSNIVGNIFLNSTVVSIFLYSSGSNTISGNTFKVSNSGYGMDIEGGSSNNVVNGNSIIGANDTLSEGIYLGSGGTNHNIISSNTIKGVGNGVLLDAGSLSNTVTGNVISESGGATTNEAILLVSTDSNTITDNTITDSSATTNNYAIDISDNASDTNYIANNTLGGGSINNAGTGTIYGGQVNSSGNYVIQPAGSIELMKNTNITGNLVASGDGTFNGGDLTVATTTGTNDSIKLSVTTGGTNGFVGTITNADLTAARTWTLPDATGTICLDSSVNNCSYLTTSAAATSYVQLAPGSVQTDNSANASIYINDTAGGNLLQLQSGASDKFVVDNSGNTTISGNVTVAASKYLKLTGGNTASRPSPTSEGMLYYDTGTHQLLTSVYNSDTSSYQWKAAGQDAVLVAANNSSAADKAAADYVADGTGDQAEINFALTRGSGGKVYLFPGTYTVNASISIPNNTTLAGAGAGTLITIPNSTNTNFYAIVNTDTATGTRVTIRDLRLDGNRTNQTSGSMNGIRLTGMGSASSGRSGASIMNVWSENWNQIGMNIIGDDNVISHNQVHNSPLGIYADGSGNTVTGNVVTDATNTGIGVDTGPNNTVTGNTVNNSTVGIGEWGAANTLISGNTITNTNGGTIGYGIQTLSDGDTISSNNINGQVEYGVSILGNKALVVGNTISAAFGDVSSRGIEVYGNQSVISNNYLYDNSGTSHNNAVYISGNNNSINGNTIDDASATTTNYAITITAGYTGNYLSDNILRSGTVNDLGTGTIYGGQATGTTYKLQPSSSITITGNAASTIQTTAGNLTLQAGSGTVTLGSSTVLTASGALSITSGGANTLSLDAGGAAALNLGTTNANAVSISKAGVTTTVNGALTVAQVSRLNGNVGINIGTATPSADLTFGESSSRTINVLTRTTNAAGNNLSITAGAAGSGASAFGGGILTLQGGAAAGTGNANGGGVTISGGAGVGTGAQGLVALSTSAFTSVGPLSFGADTNVNALSAGAVDLYSSITASATVSGKTLTINAPTIATVGRILYVANVGSNDFNISLAGTGISISLKPNTTATLIWNGTGWTAAGASSSTDLQAAYNNTLTSAGGAELVLNAPGGAADGLTIRNNATTPIVGGILEVQTSVGSNIMSVNNNATEYAANGGAETAGGTTTTFPSNTWTASPTGGTQATVSRTITANEFATGIAAAKVVTTGATTANQGVADQIAVNGVNTALTANLTYTVSFTVKTSSNFNTLDVVYSKDGTNTGTTACKTGATATESVWSRISCTFTAPSSGITSSNAIFIRQSNSNSAARTFFIDNLSVNVNANTNLAADGSADVAANIGAGTLNWGSVNTATVAQSTSTLYDTAGAVSVTTSATAGRGVYNKLSNNIVPANSTQYRVSFYAKGNNTANLSVAYTPDNGTTNIACQDYNAQAINASSWTLISCYFTTTTASVTNAQVRITQTSGSATVFYVDALNVNFNNNNANNVQVGGANLGGPTTLLTLDRSSSAPIAANNDAYLGSMYYDTTTGRIQCYEADGWGACGSSPDNIITLTPEYQGAVLGGPGNVMGGGAQTPGIGVMTSEFCSSETGILVVGTLCANHEARNYYHWTSPQTSQQIYSIYVVYKLPTTFKAFNDSNTIKLTAYTDSLTNGIATLQVFRKNAAGTAITACGSTAQTINTSTGTWQQTPYDAADETTCGFSGGDNIIFKIDMKSQSNGNVYVENLDFVYTNN